MDDECKNGELTDREHTELQLLYTVSVSDLAFFKNQQWQISNYVLLIYAALVGITQLLRMNPLCSSALFLSLLATAVFVVAVWILWQLKLSIEGRRDRLKKIRVVFSKCFQKTWEIDKLPNDARNLHACLVGVLAIGLFCVWWLVYFTQLKIS
jgi:hypothetical protein